MKKIEISRRTLGYALFLALVLGAIIALIWISLPTKRTAREDTQPVLKIGTSRPIVAPPPKIITEENGESPKLYIAPIPQGVSDGRVSKPASLVMASIVPVVPKRPILSAKPNWLKQAVLVRMDARPKIAIVIDDLGVDAERTLKILALPAPLTTAFLPYANHLREQTAIAKRQGHELMLHVPMEPEDTAFDPGPGALFTEMSDANVRTAMKASLAAFDGYVGINNHMGSRFTSDAAKMSVVLREVARKGLIYLDSLTSPSSKVRSIGGNGSYAAPILKRDVFIDANPSAEFIDGQLAKMEAIALRNGYVIGIGHPYDTTISRLSKWLSGLEAKGFALVPVSAIAVMKASRPQVIEAAASTEKPTAE